MTGEARQAIGGAPSVELTVFPFRIGREARANPLARAVATIERRLGTVPQLNDLYLLDPGESGRFQVSRRHCDIEYENGAFFVLDRASATGTTVLQARRGPDPRVVNIAQAGGSGHSARIELRDGDVIVFGTENSPLVFRFQAEPAEKPGPLSVGPRSVVVIEAEFLREQ